jgi:hypothetical protein
VDWFPLAQDRIYVLDTNDIRGLQKTVRLLTKRTSVISDCVAWINKKTTDSLTLLKQRYFAL